MQIKLGQEGMLPGLSAASRCLSLKKTPTLHPWHPLSWEVTRIVRLLG